MASLSATGSLYDVLGVSKAASEDEIKQAFKRKAQQSHPDKGGDRAVFESVQQAYEVLTNPQKRRAYDRFGNAGLKMSPGEMLHSAFTGDSPVPETETPVSNSLSQRLMQLERKNAELQNKIQLYQKESHVMTHEGGFEAWLRNNKVNVVSNADIAATNTITEKPVMLGRTDPVPAVELLGGGHDLASQELPRSLNAKQVLVRWLCAPVSGADLQCFRSPRDIDPSASVPMTGGLDGVGYVEKVGEGCALETGDLVLPMGGDCGTFRTYAVLPETKLLALPKTDVRIELLSSTMHFVCAYQLMQTIEEVKPGDCLVQADATSLVGQAVIQLCAMLNIDSVNIIPDSEDFESEAEALRNLGATHVLRSSPTVASEIMAIRGKGGAPRLALVQRDAVAAVEMVKALRTGCSLCLYGDVEGTLASLQLPARTLLQEGIKITGFNVFSWARKNRAKVVEVVDIIINLFEAEKATAGLEIWPRFPDSFPGALEDARQQAARFKQVLLTFASLEEAADSSAAAAVREEQQSQIGGWLASIGLTQYESNFVANGYDVATIEEMGLTDEDMDFLGVKTPLHRRKLIQLSQKKLNPDVADKAA